jgi:hypothetical protein
MADRPDLLLGPVAKAIARSVQVDLLLRGMNHRDRHRADAGLLHAMGVRVLADDLNHVKAVVADGHAGMLFSANSTRSTAWTRAAESRWALGSTTHRRLRS